MSCLPRQLMDVGLTKGWGKGNWWMGVFSRSVDVDWVVFFFLFFFFKGGVVLVMMLC